MNLLDPILFHARHNPDAVAIGTPGTNPPLLTYGELVGRSGNIARLLRAHALKPGALVAVHVGDRMLHLTILLALARLGIATVSLSAPIVPKALGVAAVIADRPAQFDNVDRVITADPLWKMASAQSPIDAPLGEINPTERWRINLVSAAVDEPKATALTQEQLARRVRRHDFVFGDALAACRRLYCDFAVQSAEGFEAILYMLGRGGAVFLFGADSDSMVQAFDLYKIEGMIAAPEGLSRYLQFYEQPGAPECGFKFIASLGTAPSAALWARVQARMSPQLLCAYGPTECGVVAAAPAESLAHSPGAVGYVVPDTAVEIVDTADQTLPAGQEGFVRVKSAHCAAAYVGEPRAASRSFRDGWFYPGDRGTLRTDRLLVLASGHT